MKELTRYIPFTKVDEAQRLVYGRATDETPDLQGDIVDYDATKKAVADYQQWGNLREMHGENAAGVAKALTLNDYARALDVCYKVVDDGAWAKVREGVYKGFSIGGGVMKGGAKLEKVAGKTLRRITDYVLTEISLVDRPANPSAVFSLVKRDFPLPKHKEPDDDQKGGPSDNDEDNKDGGDQHQEPDDDNAGGPSDNDADNMDDNSGDDEQEQPLTSKTARLVMIDLLKELGLVRESSTSDSGDQKNEFARAADVKGIQKALKALPQANALSKALGDLGKVVGDMAKVAGAVDDLQDRMAHVESLPLGTGPILREINVSNIPGQSDAVLKGILDNTQDPIVKQAIQTYMAEQSIKSAQAHGIVIGKH